MLSDRWGKASLQSTLWVFLSLAQCNLGQKGSSGDHAEFPRWAARIKVRKLCATPPPAYQGTGVQPPGASALPASAPAGSGTLRAAVPCLQEDEVE